MRIGYNPKGSTKTEAVVKAASDIAFDNVNHLFYIKGEKYHAALAALAVNGTQLKFTDNNNAVTNFTVPYATSANIANSLNGGSKGNIIYLGDTTTEFLANPTVLSTLLFNTATGLPEWISNSNTYDELAQLRSEIESVSTKDCFEDITVSNLNAQSIGVTYFTIKNFLSNLIPAKDLTFSIGNSSYRWKEVYASYFKGTADAAFQDGDGNIITSKYVTIDTNQSITGKKTFVNSIIVPGNSYIYGIDESGGSMIYFDGEHTIIGSIGTHSTKATHLRSTTGHLTVSTDNNATYTVLDTGNSGITTSNNLTTITLNTLTATVLASSHSASNITQELINNWNAAYNFVNTITKDDTNDKIDKWYEIESFLDGINDNSNLNTLLSQLFTNISAIDGKINLTIGGTLKEATASGIWDIITSALTIKPCTQNVSISDYVNQAIIQTKDNTLDLLADGGSTHTIIQLGAGKQLGFTDNGNLWIRNSLTTDWGPWRQLITTTEYALLYLELSNLQNRDCFEDITCSNINTQTLGVLYLTVSRCLSDLTPNFTNRFSLGTDTLKWKNIYSINFIGNLVGTASYATNLQNNVTLWGQTFTGSNNVVGSLVDVADITFSGSLYKNYATASTVPALKIGSNNLDVTIFRVYSSEQAYADLGRYGFDLKYLGTGSGNDNKLVLYADNLNASVLNQVFEINQVGNITVKLKLALELSDTNTTIGSVYVRNTSDNNVNRISFIDFIGQINNNLSALEIFTYQETITLTNVWQTVSIPTTLLSTLTYVVKVEYTLDSKKHYASGIISWVNDTIQRTDSDELLLHQSGEGSECIYLRTTTQSNKLILQISSSKTLSSTTYLFKFKKVF